MVSGDDLTDDFGPVFAGDDDDDDEGDDDGDEADPELDADELLGTFYNLFILFYFQNIWN